MRNFSYDLLSMVGACCATLALTLVAAAPVASIIA